jgi:hypothetical protein
MSGHIRRARPDERERVTEIRFAVQENRLDDPTLVTDEDYAWFEEHPGIWVWEEGGQILGFPADDTRDGTIQARERSDSIELPAGKPSAPAAEAN